MKRILFYIVLISMGSCKPETVEQKVPATQIIPEPDFTISADKNHNKFSNTIPYQIKVPDGSIVEAYTLEATGGQLNINSTLKDFKYVDMDKVHCLTGPIYVEGAEIGDVLTVELLDLEPGDWGWTGMGRLLLLTRLLCFLPATSS
jgi:Acetamidase/Formamidase family